MRKTRRNFRRHRRKYRAVEEQAFYDGFNKREPSYPNHPAWYALYEDRWYGGYYYAEERPPYWQQDARNH